MDAINESLVKAGYYRARMGTISDFDKIIGGMAWAMQSFSYDINIDVFYADSLDLGQKIALTERIVMVLLAMKCPYRIEPHQIVGLDYDNLLPAVRWLLKRSKEVRLEHEAFNRLLALRHYHRVTGSQVDRSQWCHVVDVDQLSPAKNKDVRPVAALRKSLGQQAAPRQTEESHSILEKINERYRDNKQVSFVKLASHIKASRRIATSSSPQSALESDLDTSHTSHNDTEISVQSNISDPNADIDAIADSITRNLDHQTQSTRVGQTSIRHQSAEEIDAHRKLDLELLATNQKILNLLKKLDSMPSHLEIRQYQARYVELHQQLISKNRSMKKLFDLFNSLDVTKHYLEKELNLLDSISENLKRANDSQVNQESFMLQFKEIVVKISSIRDDMTSKSASLREKCNMLNDEYEQLLSELDAA